MDWEEFRWDQDVGRWVGPFRDEAPSMPIRPGHQDDLDDNIVKQHRGLLD